MSKSMLATIRLHVFLFWMIILLMIAELQSSDQSQFHLLENDDNIFFDGLTDTEMLELISEAERQLRIFIYPIPKSANAIVHKSSDVCIYFIPPEVSSGTPRQRVLQDSKYPQFSRINEWTYPTKLENGVNVSCENINNKQLQSHFKAEYLFIEYLRSLVSVEIADSRSQMIVDDPENANAFMINHNWLEISEGHCTTIEYVYNITWKEHVVPVIENVVFQLPYFNKTKGQDHFFMAMYDFGPFCHAQCDMYDEKSIVLLLRNASYIGNFGLDSQSFEGVAKRYNPYMGNLPDNVNHFPCHRPGKDIVIPQPIPYATKKYSKDFKESLGAIYREYDSVFGSRVWDKGKKIFRNPVKKMNATNAVDYFDRGTENFHLEIVSSKKAMNKRLISQGYFTYCPCGMTCWSQRLFDALAHYTIPILANDGAVMPFERFMDWTKFTIKMSETTWMEPSNRNQFRRLLRYHVDIFRKELMNCFTSSTSKDNSQVEDSNWFSRKQLDHPGCQSLLKTLIWKKRKHYHRLTRWFDFPDQSLKSSPNDIHAFRLLTLEMWCRICKQNEILWNKQSKNMQQACRRPSDSTARFEYL